MLLLGSATSCNSKTEEIDEIAVTVSTVAVKSFTLQANSNVMANLDSVFFSIDLNEGVIFNADSLPVGTNVSRLIPVITFMTTMSKADIVVSEDGKDDTTYDYLTNATDSIDFTKKVQLKVTAYDQQTTYTYDLKVNVHNQKPDSLMWDQNAMTSLPSRNGKPAAQHTVTFKNQALSLIKESDDSFTIASSSNLFDGAWTKQEITLPFTPAIESLVATPDALWILDDAGKLYTSANGSDWTATGEEWASLIGPYMDCVLGVKSSENGLIHCHYPADSRIADPEMDPEFPLSGRSALVSIASEWAEMPTSFFVGGVKSDLSLSKATWAFDGTVWTRIDDNTAPALSSPAIFPYVANRRVSNIFRPYRASVWMLIGGKTADGSLNETVYYSYDNGITWRPTPELMQLPDYLPALEGSDGIVMETDLTANITDYWKTATATRAGTWLTPEYTIDGYDITWKCPYIYLVGGRDTTGNLSDSIWRGVLARLRFTPLI